MGVPARDARRQKEHPSREDSMNRKPLIVLAMIATYYLAVLSLAALKPASDAHADGAAGAVSAERGKYLVTVMMCNDCHTPWHMTDQGPEPDMSRMLSGHPQDFAVTAPAQVKEGAWMASVAPTMTAWSGPWGVSFTANLTPDPETGLGKWTAETFITALRTGRHEGQGRPILPPMPYKMISKATDEDLRSIFAYLQTIPAIQNRVPQPIEPTGAQ